MNTFFSFNLLQPGAAYLYPLKTSENVSGAIRKQHRTVMSKEKTNFHFQDI